MTAIATAIFIKVIAEHFPHPAHNPHLIPPDLSHDEETKQMTIGCSWTVEKPEGNIICYNKYGTQHKFSHANFIFT
jgi:hypothetical protein